MTEPTKVNLPAWFKGDGQPNSGDEWYLVRRIGDARPHAITNIRMFDSRYEYCGPLEFIFAEEEQPIQIPGWTTPKVYAPHDIHKVHIIHCWHGTDSMTLTGTTRAEAIRRFNAAARAIMEAGE